MFITIEGGEGCGKSTLVNNLIKRLNDENIDFINTKEPGGTDICSQIRSVILNKNNTLMDADTEALLYAADRNQHLKEVIIPALKNNKIVICDRYIDSNFVYQGYARNLGIEKILKFNEAIGYLEPDLTFVLDIEPQKGLDRINKDKQREVNRLDLESLAFHNKVREGYLDLAKKYPRIVIINADRTPEEVVNEVYNIIISKIKKN